MNLKALFKLASALAPVLVPAAPLVIAGAKAVIRSQKRGGSLAEELPVILTGAAAAKTVHEAFKARKR